MAATFTSAVQHTPNTTRGNTMGNVVADVTAHVQRMARTQPTMQATPAQYGTAAGYPGSKASALRAHIARQHGQGARATGHTRYPAVTPAQMLALLGAGHAVRKPEATAQARKQASSKVGATLWPKVRKAGGKGARKAKAQASTAEPTAQGGTLAEATALAASLAQGVAQGVRIPLNVAGKALVAQYPAAFANLPAGALE